MPFSGPTSIRLDAADGTGIPNLRDPDPSPEVVARTERALSPLLRATATRLTPPTGRYNCFGLVFGVRRTQINVPGCQFEIDDLLRRDGSQRAEPPQAGDIVVYRAPAGDVVHAGFVRHVDRVGAVPVVRVWSKWGVLGEYDHQELHVPDAYLGGRREYWRLRP